MTAPPADITDLIASLIVSLDPQGRVMRINRACKQVVGLSRELAIGRPFVEVFVDNAHAPQFEQTFAQLQRSDGPAECECDLPRDHGNQRTIAWSFARNERDGKLTEIIATGIEITSYRRDPAGLREQAELFRMAVAHSPDLIFYQDTECRITWVSRTIPPTTVADVLGKTDADFLDAPEAARLTSIKRRILQTGVGERIETRVCVGDEWHYLETAVERRTAADGTILGLVGYARDVTERKRAEEQLKAMNETLERRVAERTADLEARTEALARSEEALRLSEHRLRLLIDQAPVSIQTFSPDGFILDVNKAWEKLFGVTVADIPGYNVLQDQQLVEKGLMPQIRRAFAGHAVVIEPMFYTPDRGPYEGRALWMQAWMYPVRVESGLVREVVLIHQDITEKKQAEDRLRESERHYRELADYNRRLVREVEHRVRNNLSGLLGLVEVMRRTAADVPAFANAIEGRLRALAHVHDLLATSGWQSVGLRTLVSSTLSALHHMAPHPAAQTVSGPEVSVPPKRVSPLTMILVEWFTNSCKYGAHSQPGGRLEVAWQATPQTVRLCWRESGGPPAMVSPTPSLGTELVNAFATRELDGRCHMEFHPDGASHVLEFPYPNGSEGQTPQHLPLVT
ncbi:MAG TPA: PAS domain S-box protein [Tepidisphaeraceae bacterium]|nr:PAS domain S-box protein [Tepidisphaeraceae bacterium]